MFLTPPSAVRVGIDMLTITVYKAGKSQRVLSAQSSSNDLTMKNFKARVPVKSECLKR
ncbi:uncharacterized protein METZ01_LOCUS469781, partial [marine metagenome]